MVTDGIKQATDHLSNALIASISTIDHGITTKQTLTEFNIQSNSNVLLGTIQLMFSDLLSEVTSSNQHKLFYLKSKIDTLDNGQSLTTAQSNYLTILKEELTKLNKKN